MTWFDKIVAKYPEVIKNNKDFSVECGAGWSKLLDDLFYVLASIEVNEPEVFKDFSILQIKEKFGSLRFYYSGGGEGIARLVRGAEKDSSDICELCGKPGKLASDKYWLVVRCDKCLPDDFKYTKPRKEQLP